MDAKTKIEETAAELGITMEAVFVPWSKSRNATEKNPSLNWEITLHKDGREILATDYGAGMGHCPSYPNRWSGMTIAEKKCVDAECETGKPHFISPGGGAVPRSGGKLILPELADVLYSLASDASAIDYATFEEWAGDFGYDVDSRSAEKIYRACLEIALKLRSAIGEAGLAKLRDACQDY